MEPDENSGSEELDYEGSYIYSKEVIFYPERIGEGSYANTWGKNHPGRRHPEQRPGGRRSGVR